MRSPGGNYFAKNCTIVPNFVYMYQSKESIYTLHFILLCLSNALFSASFNMMIPELPAYLTRMGGADYKGYIIGLFTLMAGLSRPFSGKLTDTIGRAPVMIFGSCW